jgi:hypothetical protein
MSCLTEQSDMRPIAPRDTTTMSDRNIPSKTETQLRFTLSDAQQAIEAALGWLTSDVDVERAVEILRTALKGPVVPRDGENADANFLRELAHYTSTLSLENEARVLRIADLLETRCGYFAAETPAESCLRNSTALTVDEIRALEETTEKMRQTRERFDVGLGTSKGRWYINDDDFHWDAALAVSGDFESEAEKLRYMQAICDVLNANEDKIPYRPAQKTTTATTDGEPV